MESGAAFAIVTADWVFCYGKFGYGESYQVSTKSKNHLKNCLLKAIMCLL